MSERDKIILWFNVGIILSTIAVTLTILLGVFLYNLSQQDPNFPGFVIIFFTTFYAIIFAVPLICQLIFRAKVFSIKKDSNVLAFGILTIIFANIPAGILLIVYRHKLI